MQSRHVAIVVTALVLIGAVLVGMTQAFGWAAPAAAVPVLENVRDYAPPVTAGGSAFTVDASGLYVGHPGHWVQIPTPPDAIMGAVAVDRRAAADGERAGIEETIYLGPANELAVYRTRDRGLHWLRVPLTGDAIGGVTDLAFDPVQRILYAATDTAGLFRLRDVGSSMITGGQLLVDVPVRQVVVDPSGSGMAFARTDWDLFRAEHYGLAWAVVENLQSSPTALAVAGDPPVVLVGTVDRGLLRSTDGLGWTPANDGLGFVPGSRLHVDALAADPLQPDVLYVATSYLYGALEVHQTPSRVALSTDGAQAWTQIGEAGAQIAELLPVSGQTGAVYALTVASRTPAPLGEAPAIATLVETPPAHGSTELLAWIVAGLAAIALGFALASDVRRGAVPGQPTALGTQPVRNDER